MDSLLVAIAVALVVWLIMRRATYRRARQRMAAAGTPGNARDGGPEGAEAKTMPRMGVPGTVTREQLARLRACDFEPSRHWSREEADLILEAVTYLRAAIARETGDRDPPIEVQNKVLAFILTDETLRGEIMDWSLNRTREEERRSRVEPPRDATYDKVAAFIKELWENGTGDGSAPP